MIGLDEYQYCRERLVELCPSLSLSLIDELSLGWRIASFEKREHLVRAGCIQEEAFMIVRGLVRAYYPAKEEDVTINFVAEGEFATHYTSLEAPRPSRFSFQSIEPTIAVAISYAHIQALSTKYCETERLLRTLLEHEYMRLMAHTESLLIRSAEDRYRLFISTFGYLMPRISITELASYLGVSRQNLTLIRKRMLEDQAASPPKSGKKLSGRDETK